MSLSLFRAWLTANIILSLTMQIWPIFFSISWETLAHERSYFKEPYHLFLVDGKVTSKKHLISRLKNLFNILYILICFLHQQIKLERKGKTRVTKSGLCWNRSPREKNTIPLSNLRSISLTNRISANWFRQNRAVNNVCNQNLIETFSYQQSCKESRVCG